MLINGRPAEVVSAADRGLMYGDGLFTSIAVRRGQTELWSRHWARLVEGCRRLGMSPPDEALVCAERDALIAGCEQGVLRLTLTRGSGGRGYRYAGVAEPTRILGLYPWPDYSAIPEAGVSVRLCRLRLGIQPALAGLKSLNRLEQVMARAEWSDASIHEGIVLDAEGRVIEGTMSNLFLVSDGVLVTPALERCGVAGIMRAELLALADEASLAVAVRDVGLDELMNAEEVFLCNSLIRIWPVATLMDRTLTKGPITARLMALLTQRLA